MPTDLSAGLDPAFEYFVEEPPANPQMRDSATLWVMDDSGALAFPRVTFDAIGEDWDNPWVQLNFVDRDGTTLRVWSRFPGRGARNADGHATSRGAGPFGFECVVPFRHWRWSYEGTALRSTTTRQREGQPDGDPVTLSFRFDAEMAAPPWLMGGVTAEAAQMMKAGDAGALMGGMRYEQLCRVTGVAIVDGVEHRVTGTGMRVRRRGVRNMGAAIGHCQHSALFPSGKAFGAILMAPGPEGPVAFNEAFLYHPDGSRLPARIVRAPWMTRLVDKGDDASLLLESELGPVEIAGEVVASLFDHDLFEMSDTSILHQGTARYRWDGEETIGLIERCTLKTRIEV